MRYVWVNVLRGYYASSVRYKTRSRALRAGDSVELLSDGYVRKATPRSNAAFIVGQVLSKRLQRRLEAALRRSEREDEGPFPEYFE